MTSPRNGKKYLTGFVIDPRKFIVDYLWTRYKKRLPAPKRIQAVLVRQGEEVYDFKSNRRSKIRLGKKKRAAKIKSRDNAVKM
jgi:hypothetical protein